MNTTSRANTRRDDWIALADGGGVIQRQFGGATGVSVQGTGPDIPAQAPVESPQQEPRESPYGSPEEHPDSRPGEQDDQPDEIPRSPPDSVEQ